MATIKNTALLNNNDDYFKKLFTTITLRHRDFLRISNHELLTLYWKIGNILRFHFQEDQINDFRNPKVIYLIDKLNSEFGPFLNSKNIKQIVEFSTYLSETPNFNDISMISWEHIQVLLSEKKLEGWHFYLKQILENDWAPDELAAQIESNLFQSYTYSDRRKIKTKRKSSEQRFSDLLALNYGRHSLLQNFFHEPLLHDFEKLMKPKKMPLQFFSDSTLDKELVNEISNVILTTQKQHARKLNAGFNKLLYDIGKTINEQIRLQSIQQWNFLFEKVSDKLNELSATFFQRNLLEQIFTCLEVIPENLIFIRLANLITWEQVVVLLPLCNSEAILFYARFAAENGLNTAELIKAVENNVYETTPDVAQLEKKQIETMHSYTSKMVTKKRGNTVFTGTEVTVDFGADMYDSDAVTDIFENHYFMNFITIANFRTNTI